MEERGGTAVIPAKTNRKEPMPPDTVTYKLGNRIERCLAELKCSGRHLNHKTIKPIQHVAGVVGEPVVAVESVGWGL